VADVSVGQRVPYFELPDHQDFPWDLSGQLEVGPAVLIFYRGDW
jgi:peroxiredoxin